MARRLHQRPNSLIRKGDYLVCTSGTKTVLDGRIYVAESDAFTVDRNKFVHIEGVAQRQYAYRFARVRFGFLRSSLQKMLNLF